MMEVSDNVSYEPVAGRAPLILGGHDFHSITTAVATPAEQATPLAWWFFFIPSLGMLGLLGLAVGWLVWEGIGVWGLNQPVGWAFDITNFVFWIGIGHAGTLISAVLFLFRQKWRTSINRAAEAMTIFAVMCALLFPGIHIGRPWLAYWMAPLPNQMGTWPGFRSPLLWDFFAVSTYGTVSALFWYIGLIPDLASLRDRAKTQARRYAYGFFALGWRGSNRQWRNYEMAYLLLAGLSTPLVLSVHTVVSFDFATSNVPGWHATIFPPYFVAGAVFGGFAMVLNLLIPARRLFGLHALITNRHLENMAKVILAMCCIIGYAYSMEFFTAWYSGSPFEKFVFFNTRMHGWIAWAFWTMIFCNVVSPQLFWFKRFRQNPYTIFIVALFVNIGMWFERFVIIVSSLSRDFLISSWDQFHPTWVDILTFVGSFGVFLSLFLLFIRFVPMVAMSEVKGVIDDHPKAPEPQYSEAMEVVK